MLNPTAAQERPLNTNSSPGTWWQELAQVSELRVRAGAGHGQGCPRATTGMSLCHLRDVPVPPAAALLAGLPAQCQGTGLGRGKAGPGWGRAGEMQAPSLRLLVFFHQRVLGWGVFYISIFLEGFWFDFLLRQALSNRSFPPWQELPVSWC